MSMENEYVPRKEFTVSSFLKNPSGDIGSANMGRKQAFEAAYAEYKKLNAENKKFKYSYFRVDNDIIIKVQVPSSTYDDLHYDVLIRFENNEENIPRFLDKLPISFFSNSPSFTFSFAYVFKFFKNLIVGSEEMYERKTFSDYPIIRNPDATIFYEKSITQALLFIVDNKLMDTATTIFRNSIVKTSLKKILATVSTASKKLEEYKKLQKIQNDLKKAKRFNKSVNRLDENNKKRTTRRRRNTDEGKFTEVNTKKIEVQIDQSSKRKVDMRIHDNKVSNKVSMKVENRKVDSKVNMKVK